MKQIIVKGGLTLLTMFSLTCCIDEKYDLSNIDTTSEFKVKDLVVPINLESIKLGDIIEVKLGDKIHYINHNGEDVYGIKESGSFKSDPIYIPSFKASSPEFLSAEVIFPTSGISIGVEDTIIPLVSPIKRGVVYRAEDIDESIISLTEIYSDEIKFVINFSAENLPENINAKLSDIKIEIPKGLEISHSIPEGRYDAQTGEYSVGNLMFANGKTSLEIIVTKIDLEVNNCSIENRELSLISNLNIESANLKLSSDSNCTLGSSVNLNISYLLSDMAITAVSGEVEYHFDGNGLDIAPISLNELPDFLSQDKTNLVLYNPQIYIGINNPIAKYNLGFRTGLDIMAIRENESPKTFGLDNGFFTIGYDKGNEESYNFCLSPNGAEDVPSSFNNPKNVAFSTLGGVLSGNGIPSQLKINLVDPCINRQKVVKFPLGHSIEPVEGIWEFVAPLALSESSDTPTQIVYTDKVDGWGSEDLDALTIEKLEINVMVTNNLPLKANISGYPIDRNGNKIKDVEIVGAEVPENANQEINIRITGEIKNLDGIIFTATVLPTSNEALAPSQTITLSNLRAKVSGNYTKEF